jgi:hypothetical protein
MLLGIWDEFIHHNNASSKKLWSGKLVIAKELQI